MKKYTKHIEITAEELASYPKLLAEAFILMDDKYQTEFINELPIAIARYYFGKHKLDIQLSYLGPISRDAKDVINTLNEYVKDSK